MHHSRSLRSCSSETCDYMHLCELSVVGSHFSFKGLVHTHKMFVFLLVVKARGGGSNLPFTFEFIKSTNESASNYISSNVIVVIMQNDSLLMH